MLFDDIVDDAIVDDEIVDTLCVPSFRAFRLVGGVW